uniref:Uncharacterized protein MANES_09G145400 n=1 Tax=Rhizophora mucronata TaxID=61149 RepID=A0A2P2LLJ4_RHIMU
MLDYLVYALFNWRCDGALVPVGFLKWIYELPFFTMFAFDGEFISL